MNKRQNSKFSRLFALVIFSVMIIFILLPSIQAYNTPSDALKAYLEADKQENIDAMVGLTDFSFVPDSDKELFMEQTQLAMAELARTFDTTSYELAITDVVEQDKDALIFYHLTAELADTTGATSTTDADFVAVMHNDKGWKITSMQLQKNFEQNILFREATKSVGENAETMAIEIHEQEEGFSFSSLFSFSLSDILQSLGKSFIEWVMNMITGQIQEAGITSTIYGQSADMQESETQEVTSEQSQKQPEQTSIQTEQKPQQTWKLNEAGEWVES